MSTKDLSVRLATVDDIEALSTLFTRSFHPLSQYMRQTFPDTPEMRRWWKGVHNYAVLDPEVTLMVVTSKARNDSIVAMARSRYYPRLPHEAVMINDPCAAMIRPGGHLLAGTWTLMEPCVDTSIELYDNMVGFIVQTHQKVMAEKPHFFVELVGTAQEAQGTGAGRLLLEALHAEADKHGLPVLVETSNLAVGFYNKLGYETRDRLMMPGGMNYEEFILVRDPR